MLSSLFSSALEAILPTAHAEEAQDVAEVEAPEASEDKEEAEAEEEEEEEEEPEDVSCSRCDLCSLSDRLHQATDELRSRLKGALGSVVIERRAASSRRANAGRSGFCS